MSSEFEPGRPEGSRPHTAALRRARELVGEREARSLRSAGEAAVWADPASGGEPKSAPVAQRGAAAAGGVCVLAPVADPVLERFEGQATDAGDGLRLLRGPRDAANAQALRDTLAN